jgi:hypothetical protein
MNGIDLMIRDTIISSARQRLDYAAQRLAEAADRLARHGEGGVLREILSLHFDEAYEAFDVACDEYRSVCVDQRSPYIEPIFSWEAHN